MSESRKAETRNASPSPWTPGKIAYPKNLPISQRRSDIVDSIRANPVVILSGETGSGKTTQIPKMCIDAGRGRRKRIACTQPRRVAALSIAKRVSEELNVEYGREVGCKIRFTDKTGPLTKIKFMTDGMLLAEIQSDPLMNEYDTVIIDEAHERSLNIDFLLGHLNQLRKKRPDLKIIITSATIDTEKFSQAFDKAPIIEVSGRVYPVDVIYAPLDELLDDDDDLSFLNGISESIDRILDEFGNGDILVFLPTEKDIRETKKRLEGRLGNRCAVLPCFGRLSNADQQRIFADLPQRKIVLATNIAETSLTIPGIRFVIDTGVARTSRYNPRSRTKRLPIEKVSQSSANQRAGRCGRVQDGICIRLYSETDFKKRPEFSTPEIQRSNLAEVILRMMASRLGDVGAFPFIDPPSPAAIKSGFALLEELGAIDSNRCLTQLGEKLAALPIDPTAGRMLLQAQQEGVVEQMLVIASALAIPDPRERPLGKEEEARLAQKPFIHRQSDFLTLLNIWEALHASSERLSQKALRTFCKKRFLSYLRVREWRDVKDQLAQALGEFEKTKFKREKLPPYKDEDEKSSLRQYGGIEYRSIHLCLAAGLLANPGRKEEANLYRSTGDRKVMVFPGSGLFNKKAQFAKSKKQKQEIERKVASPEWILAGEIVETSRLYARTVAVIDPTWLAQMGAHILKYSHRDPHFDLEQGRVVCLESVRIHGLELQRKTVSYLKVNPVHATEIFIREGLLNEDFTPKGRLEFLESNRRLKNRMQNAQTLVKMQSWIGVEEAAYRFYAKHLQKTASIGDLNRFLKRNGPESLLMTESDLTPKVEDAIDLSAFPETVTLENTALPVDYNYSPGQSDDGVTLNIPYAQAARIDQPLLDWMVPGHLEAKTLCLLKGLPKDTRRQLQPLADTAKRIAANLKPQRGTLSQAISAYLKSNYGLETYESDWKVETIPDHLKVNVRVHDSKGVTIIEGSSAATIKRQIAERESSLAQDSTDGVESIWQAALQRWSRPIESLEDLGEEPEKRQIADTNGVPVYGYPVITTHGDRIKLSLSKSSAEAQATNSSGIGKLIALELRRELAWVQEDLKDFAKLGPVAVAFAPLNLLREQTYSHIEQYLCAHEINTLSENRVREKVEQSKAASRGIVYQIMDLLQAILETRQRLITSRDLSPDLAQEVDRLLPQDFLLKTPHWALKRMPVYLQAIQTRSEARLRDPQRDAARDAEIKALRKRLSRSSISEREKQDIAWTIEEYSLSLFAQSLGTAFPVSEKRILKRLKTVESPSRSKDSPTPQSPLKEEAPVDRPTSADLASLKSLFGKR